MFYSVFIFLDKFNKYQINTYIILKFDFKLLEYFVKYFYNKNFSGVPMKTNNKILFSKI